MDENKERRMKSKLQEPKKAKEKFEYLFFDFPYSPLSIQHSCLFHFISFFFYHDHDYHPFFVIISWIMVYLPIHLPISHLRR